MTRTKKPPTLADLRRLAKRKGRVVALTHFDGPFPLSKTDELRGLFAALSALPDKKATRHE